MKRSLKKIPCSRAFATASRKKECVLAKISEKEYLSYKSLFIVPPYSYVKNGIWNKEKSKVLELLNCLSVDGKEKLFSTLKKINEEIESLNGNININRFSWEERELLNDNGVVVYLKCNHLHFMEHEKVNGKFVEKAIVEYTFNPALADVLSNGEEVIVLTKEGNVVKKELVRFENAKYFLILENNHFANLLEKVFVKKEPLIEKII